MASLTTEQRTAQRAKLIAEILVRIATTNGGRMHEHAADDPAAVIVAAQAAEPRAQVVVESSPSRPLI